MRTTEVHENQTDEISKLSEEIRARFSEARHASGLSTREFASKLGIPVYYAEILENGILVMDKDNHYQRWQGCPFTREELTRVSAQLSKDNMPQTGRHLLDSESVFFCPVTVDSNSIIGEIHTIGSHKDLVAYMMRRMAYELGMKHRIVQEHIRLKEGCKAANRMKQRVLSILSTYQK